MRRKALTTVILVSGAYILSGCAIINKAQRADELEQELASLRHKIKHLENEKEREARAITEEKTRELSELEEAKAKLEESLKKEIGEYKARLEMTERGLVITFISEVFFDSGKDKIRQDGEGALQRVAEVLNKEAAGSPVAIEGHTDNEPIKYSAWKSNWELSSARALGVLHYLIEGCAVAPERLSANGYGEYRPVAANDTPINRQKNRRVEIVILPSGISKLRAQ